MDSPTTDDDGGSSPTSSTRTASTRRQFAYYPNMNSANKPTKPFSRSAAKRESVMALGSIEHLQHYFTKTGIAAEKKYVVPSPRLSLAGDTQLNSQSYQQARQWHGPSHRRSQRNHNQATA